MRRPFYIRCIRTLLTCHPFYIRCIGTLFRVPCRYKTLRGSHVPISEHLRRNHVTSIVRLTQKGHRNEANAAASPLQPSGMHYQRPRKVSPQSVRSEVWIMLFVLLSLRSMNVINAAHFRVCLHKHGSHRLGLFTLFTEKVREAL